MKYSRPITQRLVSMCYFGQTEYSSSESVSHNQTNVPFWCQRQINRSDRQVLLCGVFFLQKLGQPYATRIPQRVAFLTAVCIFLIWCLPQPPSPNPHTHSHSTHPSLPLHLRSGGWKRALSDGVLISVTTQRHAVPSIGHISTWLPMGMVLVWFGMVWLNLNVGIYCPTVSLSLYSCHHQMPVSFTLECPSSTMH